MTKAAVIGLGTMGPGISATLARAGMTVRAYDVSADQRAKASDLAKQAGGVLAALGVADRAKGPVAVVDSLAAALDGAELVVETVPERLDIKQAVFKEIDGLVAKTCVLASNTSGIPITKLQDGNSAPGRVVGMHWSNPAHVIPMIEVIAGNQTTPATVTWMVDTVKDLG
ncbi:MAG: 3-hydroxyacyl-CoA dehydrogenase NAD-binding domain-containing protein, partial [Alphaproteobacteria bacterium]